jgi:hypothetical protein
MVVGSFGLMELDDISVAALLYAQQVLCTFSVSASKRSMSNCRRDKRALLSTWTYRNLTVEKDRLDEIGRYYCCSIVLYLPSAQCIFSSSKQAQHVLLPSGENRPSNTP